MILDKGKGKEEKERGKRKNRRRGQIKCKKGDVKNQNVY